MSSLPFLPFSGDFSPSFLSISVEVKDLLLHFRPAQSRKNGGKASNSNPFSFY
jgi:hypothetical protein